MLHTANSKSHSITLHVTLQSYSYNTYIVHTSYAVLPTPQPRICLSIPCNWYKTYPNNNLSASPFHNNITKHITFHLAFASRLPTIQISNKALVRIPQNAEKSPVAQTGETIIRSCAPRKLHSLAHQLTTSSRYSSRDRHKVTHHTRYYYSSRPVMISSATEVESCPVQSIVFCLDERLQVRRLRSPAMIVSMRRIPDFAQYQLQIQRARKHSTAPSRT